MTMRFVDASSLEEVYLLTISILAQTLLTNSLQTNSHLFGGTDGRRARMELRLKYRSVKAGQKKLFTLIR